jgi:hypothetical protein
VNNIYRRQQDHVKEKMVRHGKKRQGKNYGKRILRPFTIPCVLMLGNEAKCPFHIQEFNMDNTIIFSNTLGTMVRFCTNNVPFRFTILYFCKINSYQFECAYAILENDNNSNSYHTPKPLHPKGSTIERNYVQL